MAARRCMRRCGGTRGRPHSFSAARFTRNETWWTTCRTNTKPTCEENCRTHTRWWTTATPSGHAGDGWMAMIAGDVSKARDLINVYRNRLGGMTERMTDV